MVTELPIQMYYRDDTQLSVTVTAKGNTGLLALLLYLDYLEARI